ARGQRLSQNFGPINRAYGYRRLNVLFTRAKVQLVMFTSMRSIDIRDPEKAGVRVLRDYLEYLEGRGGLAAGAGVTLENCVPSVRHVGKELIARGLEVAVNIGQGRVTLPLAIQAREGRRYAAGIDFDGGSTELATLERLRLRPQMLGLLGWNVIHVW